MSMAVHLAWIGDSSHVWRILGLKSDVERLR
jgi:hypothetical protein